MPVIDECLARGAKVCLHVIEQNKRVLKFAAWCDGIALEKGAFGVLQPALSDETEWLVPDVVIVPLLAFDRRGYRLGYGGGYYDSTLAAIKEDKDILSVGVAYGKQACLFNLPTEEHDLKMDFIVTEQDVHKF